MTTPGSRSHRSGSRRGGPCHNCGRWSV